MEVYATKEEVDFGPPFYLPISEKAVWPEIRPPEVHIRWWTSGDELKTKVLKGDEIDILR